MLARGPRAARAARWVVGAAAVYEVGKQAVSQVRSRVTYQVTLPASDEVYDLAHSWLLDSMAPKHRRQLIARSRRIRGGDQPVSPDGAREPKQPGLSVAYDGSQAQTVTIAGHRVRVQKLREGLPANVTLSAGDQQWFRPLEQLQFTCLGEAARDAVLAFLGDLADGLQADESTHRFYIATRWGDWRRLHDLPVRPLSTVVLRDGQQESIVADLAQFLASEQLYTRVGAPWHRGYVFHGPPGTGKTSLAKALAAHFQLDVHYVPLSDLKDDTNLLQILGAVDARSMLVLEDVDVVHASKSRDDAESQGISLSGLLNALDGLTTPHGLVTVMTTNDLSVLDAALVRPGRADRVEELGYVDHAQLLRLLQLVAPDGLSWQERASLLPLPEGTRITHAEVIEAAKPWLDDPAMAAESILHHVAGRLGSHDEAHADK